MLNEKNQVIDMTNKRVPGIRSKNTLKNLAGQIS